MADIKICRADGCVNASILDDLQFCSTHLSALSGGSGAIKIALSVCAVDSCAEKPRSTFSPYCHMHDARIRRHGDINRMVLPEAVIHTQGYRLVIAEGHPMARGLLAYEHRKVYYDAHPSGPEDCHWCGMALSWKTLQVDHLNTVRDDNRLENLAASCGPCNRDRAKPAVAIAHRARAKKYMVNGRWLSIKDAADALGVEYSSIMTRLKNGWSVERAMTEPRGKTGPKRKAA